MSDLILPYKIESPNFTTERLYGYKYVTGLIRHVENDIIFPDDATISNEGIPTLTPIPFEDIVNRKYTALFAIIEEDYIRDIILQSGLHGNFNCISIAAGFKFNCGMEINSTDTLDYRGTGEVTLDSNYNEIQYVSTGTLFDVRIFDSNGNLKGWFPICEGSGAIIRNVIGPDHVMMINAGSWTTQTEFDYKGLYGADGIYPATYVGDYKLGSDYTTIDNKNDIIRKSLAYTKSKITTL